MLALSSHCSLLPCVAVIIFKGFSCIVFAKLSCPGIVTACVAGRPDGWVQQPSHRRHQPHAQPARRPGLVSNGQARAPYPTPDEYRKPPTWNQSLIRVSDISTAQGRCASPARYYSPRCTPTAPRSACCRPDITLTRHVPPLYRFPLCCTQVHHQPQPGRRQHLGRQGRLRLCAGHLHQVSGCWGLRMAGFVKGTQKV